MAPKKLNTRGPRKVQSIQSVGHMSKIMESTIAHKHDQKGATKTWHDHQQHRILCDMVADNIENHAPGTLKGPIKDSGVITTSIT